jgi:hypothetical protein
LKKPFTKRGWWKGSRCRPCVQIPVLQKKKRELYRLYTQGVPKISRTGGGIALG